MKIIEKSLYQNEKVKPVSAGEEMTKRYSEGDRLNVFPVEKQDFYGFGGAFTNSSAYLYAQMSPEQKEEALEALFGESGLRYNIGRLCIGSSDFSPYEYTYLPEGAADLSGFSLDADRKYVIPFVKDAIKKAKDEIYFFASPWAPPAFMKENGTRYSGSKLKPEYYDMWAEYMVKFVEEYEKEGIHISALTPQNEPNATQTWESCFYTAEDELNFIKVLDKVLTAHNLDTKILVWDHNKEGVFDRASVIYPEASDRVIGLGFHWYSGDHFEALEALKLAYPDKLIVETEFCKGLGTSPDTAPTSSFRREYVGNLTHYTNAICEWNLILDQNGEPYHNRLGGGCTCPVAFNTEKNRVEFPDLYAVEYTFAHFIKRGAKILATSTFDHRIGVTAAKNPDGTIVVCVNNDTNNAYYPALNYLGHEHNFSLPENSMMTLVIDPEN